MRKKAYQRPTTKTAVALQVQMLCASEITKIDGDGIGYGGGGTGPARAPQCDDWDVWGDD